MAKSHFVAGYSPYEKLSSAHQHRCSILIEQGNDFFEVKGNFFKEYPMKVRHKIEWWLLRRRDTVEKAACWRARRLMSGFDFFVQRYEYLATATSDKVHRHVVILRISEGDFKTLMEKKYLRKIEVNPEASRHARARAALFGLSLFTNGTAVIEGQSSVAAE